VYFNQEEIEAIQDYSDENGLSESAALRQLMLRGLRGMKEDIAQNIIREMCEPGVRNHFPRALHSA
jgi:hypothetical protein